MGQSGGMSDPEEDPASVWDLDQLISNKVRIKQVIEERTILRATQKHWVVELAAAHTPIPPGKTEALSRTPSSLNLHLTLRLHSFGKHFNKASRKDLWNISTFFTFSS